MQPLRARLRDSHSCILINSLIGLLCIRVQNIFSQEMPLHSTILVQLLQVVFNYVNTSPGAT